MKTTRCKFRLDKIEITMGTCEKVDADGKSIKGTNGYSEYEPCEMRTIVMAPVYGNKDPAHENTKFWQATPGGELRLNVVNLAAVEHMQIGREYYVDIIETD